MAFRELAPFALSFLALLAAAGCGGASDTDFTSDDGTAGDSAGEAGNGGAAQGGSSQGGSSRGGASQGGASGSSSGTGGQGGADPNGGSTTGGVSSGGASGTETGGATTGGEGGTSAGGGSGGPVGGTGGTSSGGAPTGGTGGLPSDCPSIIAQAQAALAAAQVCDPTTDGPKCTGKVEDLCDCIVPVNDASSQQTQTYLGLREAAIQCGVPCLAIVCAEPTTVTCGFGGVTTRIVARAQCTYSPR